MNATANTLVVPSDLDLQGRRDFLAAAAEVVSRVASGGGTHLTLDCSNVETIEDPFASTLTVLARNAHRFGLRVRLDMPSVRLRQDMNDLGIAAMFIWPD